MNTSDWSQDVYSKAWNFASAAHLGQKYGDNKEYINHIGSVAMEILWALSKSQGINGNLALQCALLHDTIEDTDCTYEQIVDEFGVDVADGVLALTKNESLSTKREQMEDSLARIKQQPKEIFMVKLADRITNLSPPPSYWDIEKCNRYREEAKLILNELGEASEPLANRLQLRIDQYKKYTE